MINKPHNSLDNIQSKEELKAILHTIKSLTGRNQETIAIEMGYKKNYISEILSPTGVVTGKFLKNIKLRFSDVLEGKKKGPGTEPAPDFTALLTQLIAKQNQLMEMQNKILTETKQDLSDKVKTIYSNSDITLVYLQAIARELRVEHAVIMRSNDRLEHNPEGTLQKEAGKLETAALEEAEANDKKAAAGK